QKRPLTVENLKSLVNNGVTEKRLQELVRDRGIAFVPDQDALQSLRAGGVPESVLAELPAQARRDLPAYRQQLYEAGQKEDWSAAASLTKRILFVDPNDREAQSELGWLYVNGQGVPQDYGEALKWYRKAAEQNDPRAQNSLGLMYENARGVTQDYGEALKWYRKATAENRRTGKNNRGRMYVS